MYICVTHVDSITKIPGYKAPMKNGPVFPKIKGLNIEWWDASNWPLDDNEAPRFFGTCDDDAIVDIPGVLRVFEDTETKTAKQLYDQERAEELRARSVPNEMAPVFIRLALIELNLIDEVTAHFDSYDAVLKPKIKEFWEYTTTITRDHPIITKIGQSLSYDDDKLDSIFIKAKEISEDLYYPFTREEVLEDGD